jgi:hypothetical protein
LPRCGEPLGAGGCQCPDADLDGGGLGQLDHAVPALTIPTLTPTESNVLWLVTIDLSDADLGTFERYEAAVLGLVPSHGGRVELRVRALDRRTETHLLYFPGEEAFERFRSDPARLALSAERTRCGARSAVQSVERIES